MRLLTSFLLVVLLTPTIARANDAQAEFDRRYIGFEDRIAVNVRTGWLINEWQQPFEGDNRVTLSYTDFYTRVGRPDLAKGYRRRRGAKIAIAVVGALVAVTGIGLLAGTYASNSDDFQSCIDHSNPIQSPPDVCKDAGSDNTGYIAGGVGLAAGLVGVIVGLALPIQPTTPRAEHELADRYNQKLRDELGLDQEQTPGSEELPPGITLAPSAGPKGGGLNLTARF